MGHRHLFRTSQMFENHDQNWNNTHEQPHLQLGTATTVENGSFALPMDNVSTGAVNSAPHWNLAPRPTDYSSSSIRMDPPHHQVAAPVPFYDPFMHPSVAGSYCSLPQNYSDRPSSSSHGQTHGVEGGVDNSVMANGRGACKRKSPVTSVLYDRGSTSSYYDGGSSSGFSLSSDLHPEKLTRGAQKSPWDPMCMTSNYRGNNLSIAEACQRNVRSRSTLDLEMNLARTHLSNYPYGHLPATSHPITHSGALDLTGATSGDWNHPIISPPAQGRIPPSEITDTSGLSRGPEQFFVGCSSASGSVEFNGHSHNHNSSRNSIAPVQTFHGPAPHSARGGRSSYAQRATPSYRTISSYPRAGHVTSSENGLQSVPEAYASRHSSLGWRSNERNGRPRISYDRLRPFSDDLVASDRMVSEGMMMMDQSGFYGSRTWLDQHRDMRLDVDNMTYEELLALGERIGSVSTGVSEDSISECLIEATYSSNHKQEEGTCVICLEEYKNKDEIGTMMKCGHDYHAGCIKKWLAMKNVCPICKGPALDDDSKDK